jgi:hypothetical protein
MKVAGMILYKKFQKAGKISKPGKQREKTYYSEEEYKKALQARQDSTTLADSGNNLTRYFQNNQDVKYTGHIPNPNNSGMYPFGVDAQYANTIYIDRTKFNVDKHSPRDLQKPYEFPGGYGSSTSYNASFVKPKAVYDPKTVKVIKDNSNEITINTPSYAGPRWNALTQEEIFPEGYNQWEIPASRVKSKTDIDTSMDVSKKQEGSDYYYTTTPGAEFRVGVFKYPVVNPVLYKASTAVLQESATPTPATPPEVPKEKLPVYKFTMSTSGQHGHYITDDKGETKFYTPEQYSQWLAVPENRKIFDYSRTKR